MSEPLYQDVIDRRQCAFCGDWFTPNTGKQIYDCLDCRYRASRQKAFEKRQAERAAKLAAAAQ